MDVHENVAFDPGVGAVQIEVIISCAIKDIVDNLQNSPRALSAREIDGVVEAPGASEVVVAENAITTDWNSIDAMEALRAGRRRVGGKETVLNDEGTVVEGDVFDHWCRRPRAVVNKDK